MALRLMAALVVAMLGLVLPGCDAHAEDKEAMRDLWRELDRCNNGRDGKGVLEVFSESSYPPYDKILKAALDGSKEDLRNLAPSARLEVLRIRARAKREDVEELTGKQYVAFATSRGWYAQPPERQREDTLKRFTFKEDHAWAEAVGDGERSGVRVHFVRERDAWRLDESASWAQWDALMRRQARNDGMKIDEFVLAQLEGELGKAPPDSVWEPMPKAAK